MYKESIKRGDIYYADLGETQGSEQGGIRPVLIVQNDIGNKHSPTVIIAAITSQINKSNLPTHVFLKKGKGGLSKDSIVMMEQVRTIDKDIKLKEKIGHLGYMDMLNINMSIIRSFGLAVFTEIYEVNHDKKHVSDNKHTPSVA